MKLKFSSNSINVSITNDKGESIYNFQADSLNTELDVAKLGESIAEIQQTVFTIMEKALTEPTLTAAQEA